MYGFLKEETQPDHWVVGSKKASGMFGAATLMKNGHGWKKYLPTKELQNRGFETQACTVFGTANCLETLANYYGFKDFPKDLAERYNGVLAEIGPTGGYPHKTCETFRLFGGIPETALPFSKEITSWDAFYSPNPMDENLVQQGQQLLSKYVVGHEWVFNGENIDKKAALKSALSRGTVAVSVYAWDQVSPYYVKTGDDNHWVQLVDYEEGEYWLVNDHYDPQFKKLAWDFDFYCAKLFFLTVNTSGRPAAFWDLLLFLISKGRFSQALKLLTPSTMPPETPKQPQEPSRPSNREILYLSSKRSIGADLTPDDKVPDYVACVAQFQALFFKTFVRYVGTGAARVNTQAIRDALKADAAFTPVSFDEALPGDVCVFATGEARNPQVKHGHIWVVGKNDWMSNNSETGRWDAHKTKQQVKDYYITYAGFTPFVFRLRD